MPTETRQVTICNTYGLHARSAMKFVDVAGGFRSKVSVRKDDLEVDGKTILDVLSLAAERGHALTIVAEGEDAAEAADALATLVQNGFGE